MKIQSSGTQIHPVHFRPGVIAEPLWYAIQTRSRHEKFVDSQLKQQGITTFLPLVNQLSFWSDRRKLVRVPLFSNYLFVQLVAPPEGRLRILSTHGVLSLVGNQGKGIPIPGKEIENIQRLLTSNLPFVECPFVRIGQRVRIRGGCMDGVEGIFIGRSGNRELVISVETIERSVAIHIEGYDVELI